MNDRAWRIAGYIFLAICLPVVVVIGCAGCRMRTPYEQARHGHQREMIRKIHAVPERSMSTAAFDALVEQKANEYLGRMTVQEMRDWADRCEALENEPMELTEPTVVDDIYTTEDGDFMVVNPRPLEGDE